MDRLTRWAVALALLLIATSLAAKPTSAPPCAPAITGSVCVNRFGPDPPKPCPTGKQADEAPGLPEFRWESTVFKVQIDDREPVEMSCTKSAIVDELALGQRHLIRVWLGERRVESFYFTFEEQGAPRLCLQFGPGYSSWMLEALQPGTKKPCRCVPSREP